MRTSSHLAWGRVHRFTHDAVMPRDVNEAAAALRNVTRPVLGYGRGRSYGDSCLNEGGLLLDTRYLDRFLSFDAGTGLLRAGAGVTLAEVLACLCRPDRDGSAWFPAVTPGTRWISLGGAVANDVHGKNHHRMGSFGSHIRALTLVRQGGRTRRLSECHEPELYAATIGGLGLTGLIVDVTLQLRRVPGLMLVAENIRFENLDEFYALSAESEPGWEYSVAWIDCLATGRSLGRGIFSRANHVAGPIGPTASLQNSASIGVTPPISPLNRLSLRMFNSLYWRRLGVRKRVRRVVPYSAVLYPLDAIEGWNRLYGPRGFYQYQCVLPQATARAGIAELLAAIARAAQGSFLAVLKTLGESRSPGLLSFPMLGTTLALDFPNRGSITLALLERLDAITRAAGGRPYPAKDGRMDAATFEAGYPALSRFRKSVDPAFSSSFWRRVAGPDIPTRSAFSARAMAESW